MGLSTLVVFLVSFAPSTASADLSSDSTRLRDLLTLHAKLAARSVHLQAAYDQALKCVQDGDDLPTVRTRVNSDPGVDAARRALQDAYQSGRNVDRARMRLDDVMAEVRAKGTSDILESLRRQQETVERQVGEIDEEVRGLTRKPAASTTTVPTH